MFSGEGFKLFSISYIIFYISLVADVFSQSEQAQTLTEIAKIDPSFNKENFLKECEFEIIPTVLEVFCLRIELSVFCFALIV